MQFIEFKAIGTDERKERIEIVSDGQNLHFVGSVQFAASPARTSVEWRMPILGLTSFKVALEDVKRGIKREKYRTVQLSITLWDGRPMSTGPIEFADGEAAEIALESLKLQVALANYKWPMCKAREVAVRRLIAPGQVRRTDLLGPQGREAFESCLDTAPRALVDAWAGSELAHEWPSSFVASDEGGKPVFLALMPDRLVYVRPHLDQPIREVFASTFASVDLHLGDGESSGFAALLIGGPDGTVEHLWMGIAQIDIVKNLYRYALALWSVNRPYDEASIVDAITQLDHEHSQGIIDTVTFSALVNGIARRASGEPTVTRFPVIEERYIRPPAIAQQQVNSRPGTNPAQMRQAAVGVGLLAAVAGSMMDD